MVLTLILYCRVMFAGALVSVLINIFKRSPVKPTETLIDFNVAIALTPVVLVGVDWLHQP